jgi:predicted nucleic acid-binding protein
MALLYADSSVLVKRHMTEIGSAWVEALFKTVPGRQIATSRLSTIEVVSALNRRRREGSVSQADYIQLRDDFLALCRRSYRIIPITNSLLAQTRALLERHPLRAYDALHLAAGLAANQQALAARLPSLTFLAADNRLLAAAQAEGLAVDDPNNHP